jgi:hypothetical protein
MKVKFETLPSDIREFVIDTNFYTVDNEGYVYDPVEKEYPDIEDIEDQITYTRTGDL